MDAAASHGMPMDGGKGALGLTTLSEPTSRPVADIIFVHGLGGGSRKTWSYSLDPDHFWPEKWLAKDPDFANVGVHSFGYAADWTKVQRSILEITNFSHLLLNAISSHRRIGQGSGGIIFCCHSLGGCVAKMAYILAREDPLRAALASRICSMIFLGTPHRGSDLAKLLSRILSVSLSTKAYVKSLSLDSAELQRINDLFRKHASPIKLWSFYETLPTRFLGFGSLVVEPHSATLDLPGEEMAPLDADHRQICKFKTSHDQNYKTIRNSILAALDASRLQQRQNFVSQCEHLRAFLHIHSMVGDDFGTLRVLKNPGSCGWLLERPQFTSWASFQGSHPPIFWLTASPGSGKSVLSSHVLDTLKSRSHTICSGFTFQNAKSGTSTFSECLRSLAYQMGRDDPEVLARLLQLEEEVVLWDPLDELQVWRKLFVENIFKASSLSRHVWVIDGLDECANYPAVFTKRILSSAPSDLRIFLTSRPVETINRGIRALGPKASQYQLSLHDTAEDIERVVMAGLDALDILEDEDEKKTVCDTIMHRSAGMFLWVRLVLQEFESTVWSTEDIHSVLRGIPDGISELYTRCLRPALHDERTLKLIKPVLTWAILGSRTFTAQEIRSAVKLEINETLQNIEKAIPSITAQLLSVGKGMVHAIHETFHEFLLSKECPQAIRIAKPQAHSRIATLLLQHLAGDHMRPVIRQDSTYVLMGSNGNADMDLVDYAARHFSDHLSESDPTDGELLGSLCRFLESNGVLAWMALSAADNDTHRLARVADCFEKYLIRSQQVLDTDTDPKHKLIRRWASDLFRFSCKFGPQLADSPGSFFDMIPSLCPSSTVISEAFQRFMSSSLYRALRSAPLTWWGPLLASRECEGTISTTAHGCGLFAAVRGELVGIYDQRSTQWLLDIPLPGQDQVKPVQGVHEVSLAFSPRDDCLAIHHQHHVFVFELPTGALLYEYHLDEDRTGFEAGSRSYFAFASETERGFEAASGTCLAFPASNRLVLLTAKRITCVSWEGRPGNNDTIRQALLPTKESPEIPPSQWWINLSTDGDRSIVVFGVQPNTESVMLWDSEKDEIIAEYWFAPRKPGGDPELVSIPGSSSTSEPSWPPKHVASSSGKEEPAMTRPGNLNAWISPSLALPVLVILWVYDDKFRLSIADYSSRMLLYDLPPQPYFRPGATHIVSASFSGDGSTFIFLQQDLIFIYRFGIENNVRVGGIGTYIPLDDIYDELVPTFANGLRLQLNFDGMRFMLVSPSTLSALVLYARKDDRQVHMEHRSRDIRKREMKEQKLTGPLPSKDEHRDAWFVGSEDEARITLLFPRSLTTVRVWKYDLHPLGKLNSSARICTELVMNDGKTRAAWECNWFIGEEQRTELFVADLAWSPDQKNETAEQNLPTFDVVLREPVDSRCNSLILNKSGDRLIRRTKNDCELWELPSWKRLAKWNLWQFWPGRVGLEEQRGAVWLPLVQHVTDPEWLLCVNVFAPRSVAMLSWRDFTLSMGVGDGESEVTLCPDSAEPPAGQSPVRQPTRPDQLAALLHGLELLIPEIVWGYNDGILLWKECFAQYTLLCAARNPCFATVDRFFARRGFLPIAFLAASRTLVFLGSDMWIYSTQLPAAPDGDSRGSSLPTRPPWICGPGASPPSCTACKQSHPFRALRHLHAGFAPNERWRCAWVGGGEAPDGRRRMDFSFWGAEPTDRIVVRDALRYADEVEWVEYRNESGRVWKSELRLVEGEATDGETRTGRVV